MVLAGCFMANPTRGHWLAVWLLCIGLLVGAVACGADVADKSSAAGDREEVVQILTSKEVKHLLRQLPYRYKFRQVPPPEGAQGAIVGRAVGRHRTVLNFGIALGEGGKPVLPRPNAAEIDHQPLSGFTFSGDSVVRGPDGHLKAGSQFQTRSQWDEVTRMEVKMTDLLCRAASGKPCPI